MLGSGLWGGRLRGDLPGPPLRGLGAGWPVPGEIYLSLAPGGAPEPAG